MNSVCTRGVRQKSVCSAHEGEWSRACVQTLWRACRCALVLSHKKCTSTPWGREQTAAMCRSPPDPLAVSNVSWPTWHAARALQTPELSFSTISGTCFLEDMRSSMLGSDGGCLTATFWTSSLLLFASSHPPYSLSPLQIWACSDPWRCRCPHLGRHLRPHAAVAAHNSMAFIVGPAHRSRPSS